MNQDTLSALADILNDGGRNYTVSIRAYQVASRSGSSSEQLIRSALGDDAVLESLEIVAPEAVLKEIKASLVYAGDSGAGPDPESIRSERFKRLLSSVLADVESVLRRSSKVEQFQLREGHPAYPVYWDLSFLFTGSSESTVLVASSSD